MVESDTVGRGPAPKKRPAACMSHSAGFATRSPRGMGEPNDVVPRGSQRLSCRRAHTRKRWAARADRGEGRTVRRCYLPTRDAFQREGAVSFGPARFQSRAAFIAVARWQCCSGRAPVSPGKNGRVSTALGPDSLRAIHSSTTRCSMRLTPRLCECPATHLSVRCRGPIPQTAVRQLRPSLARAGPRQAGVPVIVLSLGGGS